MVNIQSGADSYSNYKDHFRKIADVKFAAGVLQWDQETYMPVKGADSRARQLATLTELAHNMFTDETTGQLLQDLLGRNDLSEDERRNVELSWYDFQKENKLSAAFVRLQSETISKSFQSWLEARKANNFSVFEKDLALVIALKKQEADQRGYEAHPYDALLNEYEKGCTVHFLDGVFSSVRLPLQELLGKIKDQPQVNDGFLQQHFPKEEQWAYGMELIKMLGFDLEAGRQDMSEHPFTTNFSASDVRITTRIDELDFNSMTWSCIHEVGHALYEQGLPAGEYGMPLGEYASLSIHESQSRLWENNVGRSLGFWQHQFPALQQRFPLQFKNQHAETFYKAINKVTPSLIRTEADELTYHFHVMIRYELEKLLMEGLLSAREIPYYWNEKYAAYLGVTVPDDKNGCLQDVHWSHGSFGYFPTYSLGSFYAAQFYQTAKKQLPSLDVEIRNGDTNALLLWLRKQVHVHGRKYTSDELCRSITGESLNISNFLDYSFKKYKDIYHFN